MSWHGLLVLALDPVSGVAGVASQAAESVARRVGFGLEEGVGVGAVVGVLLVASFAGRTLLRLGRGRLSDDDLDPSTTLDEEASNAEDESESSETVIATADFSVYAPAQVEPGAMFVVEAWVFAPQDRVTVSERAIAHGRTERVTRSAVPLEIGAQLTFHLCVDDLEVPESCDWLQWTGNPANASFRVRVPAGAALRDYPATLKIFQSGLLITRLLFAICVGANKERSEIPTERRNVRRAFASYASADRAAVLARVQGIRASGISVFLDALSLHAGDKWEKRLYAEIDECDELFLFWSEAASKSEWVEREWRYAYDHRGPDFISPVPLVDPRETPPPVELQNRHFNDVILALLRAG
jgi:TIR domain